MKTRYLFFFTVLLFSNVLFSQIPQLNSSPLITNKVIYLDFDGQVVTGTSWNSGNTINALPSTISVANMIIVWKRVAEDYRPFDVNVTTDSVRFNNATPTQRIRVVITPTSAWYGSAGGVAYLNSFSWGGTPGTPCWVFENMLGYSAKNIAEACSHEAGHAVSLRHQSTYDNNCVKTAEYNPGIGTTGVITWAPIMGVGYYKNITTWFNGKSSYSCSTIQYDHGSASPGITSTNFLSFLPDDVGDNYASGKLLNLVTYNLADSGIITTPTDVDVYKFSICNNRSVTIAIKPWALDTVGYNGANLDVRFQLFNSNNIPIATDTSLTKLNTLVSISLTPGDYYFTVDGGGCANYSDYGSLGKYYIKIQTTDPPFLNNSIVASPTTCVGQSTAFTATSNGFPVYWLWNFTGPSSTISILPNPVMTFNSAGIYTVSLMAYNNFSLSCVATKTINVGVLPSLTVSPNSTICPGTNLNLTASGASFYNWIPGNFAGPVQSLNPLATTIYTITGNNGMCNKTAMISVSVTPDFSVSVNSSASVICSPQTVTLTASGATSFTFNPGNITGFNSAVFTPVVTTSYSISGSNGYCNRTTVKLVRISPAFTLNVTPSDTILCEGESISLIASGAANYTFEPGGISLNPAFITPVSNTEYTIMATNADNCPQEITANVKVAICTGIQSNVQEGKNINIYPNPASGEINIETSANCKRVEIISTTGQLLVEKEVVSSNALRFYTGNWENGLYFIVAYFNGLPPQVQKVIVKH